MTAMTMAAMTTMGTMTTDRLGEQGQRTGAVDAGQGGPGFRMADGPTTTVPVIPLWERLGAGASG